jgi:hypothetical protein
MYDTSKCSYCFCVFALSIFCFVFIDMVEGSSCKEYHTHIACLDSEACHVWCRYAGYISGGYCNFKKNDEGGICMCVDCV